MRSWLWCARVLKPGLSPRAAPPPPQELPGGSAARHSQQVAPVHHAGRRRAAPSLGSLDGDSGVFGWGPRWGLLGIALITSESKKLTPSDPGK